MKANRWLAVLAGVAFLGRGVAAWAGGDIEGTVTDASYGEFKLKDKDGTQRLFKISGRNPSPTTYEPADWKPDQGDEVVVTYVEKTGRSGVTIVASKVKLVKVGPNALTAASPVDAEITQTGRASVMGKVLSTGQIVRFWRQRTTTMDPAGWEPSLGEKVRIEFHREAGRGMTIGTKYLVDKMTKLSK
jgi:hypothetical protein